MLSPQELKEKRFKQALVRGYDMAAVDEFLDVVSEDYAHLFKENVTLKNKMKVLVEKIEEYRSSEDSLRNTFIAIKNQAEKELSTTKKNCEIMLQAAEKEVETKLGALNDLVDQEKKRLIVARSDTVSFVNALRKLYQQQIDQLDLIPSVDVSELPKQKRISNVEQAAREIEQNLINTNVSPESVAEKPVVSIPNAQTNSNSAGSKEELDKTRVFTHVDEKAIEKDLDIHPTAVIPTDVVSYVQDKTDKIVDSFEVHYGKGVLVDDQKDIWEQNFDTEIPRPKYEFPDLENKFGGHPKASEEQR